MFALAYLIECRCLHCLALVCCLDYDILLVTALDVLYDLFVEYEDGLGFERILSFEFLLA